MLNNYAESGGGFNSNHGQTSRTTEAAAKQHNIGSTWSSYNSQLEGMYYGSGEQAMFMGPYDGSTKHANYPQYPHQPVPTPMVKCQEACCQHFQDRYPLNPAPLRYQPTQPRYDDSRQYFTDRRSMQPTLSRKKAYPTDNSFAGIPDRHYSQFMSRGQFMPDSRQQMQQMMRSQYPMYPPYWGSTRSYGPRMNCPPPPYHQSVSQGAQLQAGLKMTDPHYMDATQKSLGTQRHRTVGSSGGSEIIRPVPEPKRSVLDPNLQSCYEFGYPGGFVPFGEVNKIQGTGVSQNGTSCKIPSDKQYHPHQMQYAMQGSDRSMMNCSNPINELSYSMNFALPTGDPYIRAGLDDGQSISDSRKANLQYDSSLGKKRPDLDLRQYLATWEDDEEEGTRLSEPLALGNSGAPYIVVDCRSLEGEAAAKIQERFKTSQNCSSKSRSSSPSNERKRIDESNRSNENPENSTLSAEFQNQPSFAPSMPNLLNDNDKGVSFWNGAERDGEGISGKNSAFQPLDCSKRDNNVEHSKNDPQTHSELPTNKVPSTETGSMSFDNLVSYYGDTRRISDGAYDFVEMTERLVNNTDKSAVNSHQVPPAMTRPCDPRLQQSQMGNNPSIYNKVTPRYSAGNFQHYKPPVHPDPYYNFKHPINPNKYLPYDNTQILDPNYDYHKLTSDFDPARLYSNKDLTKDPRRLFHQELDKAAESAFLDPVRKAQLNDCYQEKVHCEFPNGDPNTFMPPLMVKKSDLIGRDKLYSDKNHSIRERMDVINNENQNPAEKTVLITSQNGPPEIFRVPFPPEKESSHKDNVVTLHSGDQTKSNTITVEVPYVQQYSTLVELSEEISRVENGDGKNKSKPDVLVPSKSTNDEAKKPTSFKLKRLPNSKEWAVENKALLNSKTQVAPESNTGDSESTPRCEVSGEKDCLNPPLTSSNLNMPSLDDFREEENCASLAENLSKNKVNEPSDVGNKVCSSNVDDSNKGNKYNAQPPQMAIVQPMKLNKCDVNQIESNQSCKLSINDSHDNQLDKPNGSIGQNQNSFDPEKLITSTSSNLELMSEDISKHENFRTHKKIQSFPARIPTCLPSPSEEFLHSQEMGSHKETYSPFHVYSDCDMNSQINDFFKIDDRNTSNNKDLNNRMPSSPSVEGMFEDINHSNVNNLYQTKTCDFPDLSDSNINSHDTHFQSFSTIFSDNIDRSERADGSILQMNDKKCLKNILDTNNEVFNKTDDHLNDGKSDDSKKSPPMPPISLKLKLNESKKMWCIANKNQNLNEQMDNCTEKLSDGSRNISHETLDIDAANELEKDLAQAIDEEKRRSSANYFREAQTFSEINQLLSSETNSECTSHLPIHNGVILAESIFTEQSSQCSKAILINKKVSEENENKCRTITKYFPKNKIFEKLNLYCGLKTTLGKTLVFDQYGTHFPVITEEANLIAKDIINDLISKSITDRCKTVRNNVAHVAPYTENPSDADSCEVDSTSSCALNLSTSESVMEHESSPVVEEKESIVKTTELFIQNEKKYYQINSVIKLVPSANNIVAHLRRPARSIFSPMSDHGKEDDEPIEVAQIVSSQGENLLNFGDLQSPCNSNKIGCFDLVNDSENMDVDLSAKCEISCNADQTPSVDENKISKNESKAIFSIEDLVNNKVENHAADQHSTEIDDALELMGLSNVKSVQEVGDHTECSNVLAENNLHYLQESSENETGLEDQLSPLAECANSLNLKQSSNNKESTNFTDKLTPLIENDNSNNLEKPCKSKDVLPSTANESNTGVLCSIEKDIERSDEENTVEDKESRLETSVIVRNETFNYFSSKNDHELFQNSHPHYQGSFRNYSESVVNVRNIINEVINYAVTKNIDQRQHYLENPLKNEAMNICKGMFSVEEASSPMSLESEMNSTEETATVEKCLSGFKNGDRMFQTPILPSIHSKTSVITSRNLLPLDLSTEKAICNNFHKKDSYCASECIYVYAEEPSSCIKTNGFSYFHDFKTRKWQRFHKLCSEKENVEGTQTFKSGHQETKEIASVTRLCKIPMRPMLNENSCAIEGAASDCSDHESTEPLASPDDPLCSSSEVKDELPTKYNLKRKLSKEKSVKPKNVNLKLCKSGDINSVVSVESRSTVKVGGETPNENEEEDGSTPLKDKVCFFNQKESVFLRRDSLKILEREAVLREIFSPEPENDYTESKENAYPGIFNQHKPENSKLQYCENVDTNDDLSSSVNDSTNFKGFSESSVQEVSNQNSGVYSPPSKTEIAQSEQNEISVSSSIELQPHKNKILVDSPSEMVDSFKENLRENSKQALQKPALPETESNDNQPSFLSTKLNNFNYLLNRSVEESAHDQKSKGKTEENQSTSSSEDLNLLRTVHNSPLNNETHPMSPEENSFLCQDRDILSPNDEDVSNESTISCTDMTSDNVSCNDSNTNDISTKVAPNEDTNATLLVTGKDVLFSTTQTVDDQDDEALNNNVSHKETYNSDMSFDDGVDDDQTHNITQSQNEKITSVHDSLRNNQHLNKETFPLQCLVEAALALEHVGSKQMLLNNSNFPGLYSQSDEGFVESPLSESPSHESLDYSTKTNTADEIIDRKKIKNNHSIVDGDSFSKFEETHYNLRDSTRIVTSSSCNIIPYPKRKYRFKSVKSSCATHEMKQRETDTVVNDKIKSKKRKSVFAYPRTKRRKRNTKDKPKTSDVLPEPITQDATEVDSNTHHYDESIQNDYNREDSLQNHCENIEPCLNTGTNTMNCSNNTSDYKTSSQLTNDSSHLTDDESKNNFGGPLLIANEDTTAQGNIFCVHVDSEKIDDYVGGLGILSDTNHSLFKESTDGIESEIPNVSLDNSTSLVIIIEDLDENTGKMQFDNGKSESDVMLGSVRDADCADVLTTELSVNESCICPPDIGLKNACENELKSKLLYGRSEELLTTNCYEEINENLINDIGNWPFVEEEVAEFDDRSEFPNKIPEEGRKIELKCSLPWKKIFNISKNISQKQEKKNKKKTKASKKSGLELGPANVEVRLKAPSAEWKVISDYHENSSPVVKVSRLILQRESDNSSSSYSEKDSEEENENRKSSVEHSDGKSTLSVDSYLTENISQNENWQPIVVLKRNKELDELTSRLQSQTFTSLSNSQSSSSDDSKDEESSEHSDTDVSDGNPCSMSRESSPFSDSFDNNLISNSSKKYCLNKFYETNENDRVPYEKYSPTGCSNSLANEKIYSPSNPHFSPGEVYPDSDMNSNPESVDKVSSNLENGDDDVFIDEKSSTNILDQVTEESKIVDSNHSDSCDKDNLNKESNTTDISKPLIEVEILPHRDEFETVAESPTGRKSPDDCLSETIDPSSSKLKNSEDVSETIDPPPSKLMNSEDESPSTPLDYKSSVFSNSSNSSCEVNNTESSREFHYDQTKKTRRKMPKNFFVRKKIRRNRNTAVGSDTSSQDLVVTSAPSETETVVENTTIPSSLAQNEINRRNNYLSGDNQSDLYVTCDTSRLNCVYDLEHSSPIRLNDNPGSSLPEKSEDKSTLRNCGRGLKRPGKGHFREDTKRRRTRNLSTTCRDCDVTFKNKEELTRHNAYRHARRRELHHCLLCQRSFSSAARHSLHVQGRSHRHLELTQRHTMHTIHRLVAGHDCPAIPPLTRAELRALQWRPNQPGYTHVYHDTTPLHTVLRERSSDLSEDTVLSGDKIGDD